MGIIVRIPLTRLRSQEAVNKIEVTSIDHLLDKSQKKRVAKFFRQEEAKRTRYEAEPTWDLPPTIHARRRPSATGMTWNDFMKHWEISPEETKLHTPEIPVKEVTILEIQTKTGASPSSNSSEAESDIVVKAIRGMVKHHLGYYTDMRRSLLAAQNCIKDFQGISKTRMKRLLHREKTQHEKRMKKHQRP
ncbi:hypothetical protein FRX31_008019 [Thalictrum thalictroides]|uniref:Uncharacterized protein n=1 Tax=Thalictrum thalictroides TaxID=46969 RepID=A0A7J6X1Y6_THATH|nr:hypothetical protein FRX31_008019 [Thalictrum thalictroides]